MPVRTITRGEIVKAADLAVERRPKTEVTVDVVGANGEAVGRAARQVLRQGQPMRRSDLVKPELIKRDDNVTFVYVVPGITLTTRGKALEAGAEGDVINVLNTQTKRTLQGVVTGPGRVDIAPPVLRSAAATPLQPAEEASAGTE